MMIIRERLRQLREEKKLSQGDGEQPPNIPNLLKQKTSDATAWGITGKNSIYMHKLVKYLGKSTDSDRKLLLALAQKVSGERSRRVSKAA